MEWIKITERMPDHNEVVLAYDAYYGKMKPASVIRSSLYFLDGDDDCLITHWMPMPDPPE